MWSIFGGLAIISVIVVLLVKELLGEVLTAQEETSMISTPVGFCGWISLIPNILDVVSSRLLKFKRVKSDLYNFRCPICGDSQKHKNKARGYLYAVKADMNFRCHNCGASMTFSNFLKEIDPVIHKQYVFERFKGNKTGRGTVVEEPKFNFEAPKFKPKLDLPKASENPDAKKYLENRKLDPTKFYYTDKFKAWSNSHKRRLMM